MEDDTQAGAEPAPLWPWALFAAALCAGAAFFFIYTPR